MSRPQQSTCWSPVFNPRIAETNGHSQTPPLGNYRIFESSRVYSFCCSSVAVRRLEMLFHTPWHASRCKQGKLDANQQKRAIDYLFSQEGSRKARYPLVDDSWRHVTVDSSFLLLIFAFYKVGGCHVFTLTGGKRHQHCVFCSSSFYYL